MTTQDVLRLNKAVVDAWNTHDTEKFLALCDENVVWTDSGNPQPYKGKKGAREFYELWNIAFPDFKLSLVSTVANENTVASQLEFSGTNSGILKMGDMQAPPTNKKVTANKGACFAWFKDNKLTAVSSYPDLAGMMAQLGLLHELHA